MNELTYNNYLQHFGILGMKWGVRRYQNPDGTLTEAGKRRYGTVEGLEKARREREERKEAKEIAKKDKAIATGNAKMIRKYADRMTTQELQNAATRAQYVSNVKAIQNRGKPKLNPVKTVTNALNTTSNLMNAISNTASGIDKMKRLLEDPDERKAREKEKQLKAENEKTFYATLRQKATEAAKKVYDETPGDERHKTVAANDIFSKIMGSTDDAYSGRVTKESLEAESKKKDSHPIKEFLNWAANNTGNRKKASDIMSSGVLDELYDPVDKKWKVKPQILSTKVSDLGSFDYLDDAMRDDYSEKRWKRT